MNRSLVSLDNLTKAKSLIEQANTSQLKEIISQANAWKVYYQQAKRGLEIQNRCAEIKLRAEKRLGALLAEMPKDNKGGNRKSPSHKASVIHLKDLGLNDSQSSRYQTVASLPDKEFEKHIAEVKKSNEELTTVGVINLAKKLQGKPYVSYNSGNFEWYTPPEYIAAAIAVMGSIDLDPASSDIANKTVGAKKYFTIKEDGLKQKWFGNVWMNPPYSQPLISDFSQALIDKFVSGEIPQAMVLVNNATDTTWCQSLLQTCSAYCLLKGRIKFLDSNGKAGGAAMQGQAILYFGENTERFDKVFSQYGSISYCRPNEELTKQNRSLKAKQRIEERIKQAKAITKFDSRLVLGDCLDAIPKLANKSVQCLLCDPPYGINYVSNHRRYESVATNPIVADDKQSALTLLDKTLSAIKPKMADNSNIYIFTSWKVDGEFKSVVAKHFEIKNMLVWDKGNHGFGDLEAIFSDRYELIIYAVNGRPKRIGPRVPNILRFPRVTNNLHPTEKPVDLLEKIINVSTVKGELVVDPFAGSGNTLVAAKRTGRNYFGVEIVEQWFKVAQEKLEKLKT